MRNKFNRGLAVREEQASIALGIIHTPFQLTYTLDHER